MVIFSFNCDVYGIMFVIMCASNIRYDKCLSYYIIFLSYHVHETSFNRIKFEW